MTAFFNNFTNTFWETILVPDENDPVLLDPSASSACTAAAVWPPPSDWLPCPGALL